MDISNGLQQVVVGVDENGFVASTEKLAIEFDNGVKSALSLFELILRFHPIDEKTFGPLQVSF